MVGVSPRVRNHAFVCFVLLAALSAPAGGLTASRTFTVGANVVASCAIVQETIVRMVQRSSFTAIRCQNAAPLSAITAPAPRTLLTTTDEGARRLTLEF